MSWSSFRVARLHFSAWKVYFSEIWVDKCLKNYSTEF